MEYYKLPKFLFKDEEFKKMSIESRVIYAIMLDREQLSIKNKDKFTDDAGKIFIVMTVEQIQEIVSCARPKAVKILKEIEDYKLIKKKREMDKQH